jgi:RNA polymerase sigma-70 factor (ECF subfamily)
LFSWAYRIATNETLTFLEKRNRIFAESIDREDSSIANKLEADEYFDGDKAELILREAVQALPKKQQLVFNMKYFQGMKYQEMSDVLETSVGALKASYHHAVKKIEEFVKNNMR